MHNLSLFMTKKLFLNVFFNPSIVILKSYKSSDKNCGPARNRLNFKQIFINCLLTSNTHLTK